MNSEQNMVDSFLTSKKEYIDQRTDEYLKAVIAIELEKKELDQDLKLIKLEAKQDGVDVRAVSKVYNRIKSRLKNKPDQQHDEDQLEEKLLDRTELINEIYNLIKPAIIS